MKPAVPEWVVLASGLTRIRSVQDYTWASLDSFILSLPLTVVVLSPCLLLGGRCTAAILQVGVG